MEVQRFVTGFLLIVTFVQLVGAKNPFFIQSDTLRFTYDKHLGAVRLYIEHNNINLLINLTTSLPTSVNIALKLWHRNPRGKYDMIGIPWSANACQFIKTDKMVYEGLRQMKNTELPEKCPLGPGRYYVKDYDVNQITIPIPLPMGQYRLEVKGVNGKAELLKATWNGQLVPT